MSRHPVLRRERADRDVQDIAAHYLQEAGEQVALRFVDALEEAFDLISRQPDAGSLRFADVVRIPGLRCRLVPVFPYLVFYVDREDHVEVWRVLHQRRDIPTRLRESGPT